MHKSFKTMLYNLLINHTVTKIVINDEIILNKIL